MARLVDESFEAAGYEEAWTETVGVGNTVDEDAAIPGSAPTGSGSQCLNCILAGTNTNAYTLRDVGSSQAITYVRAYIYIDSWATSVAGSEYLVIVKGAVNNLYVSMYYSAVDQYTWILGHYDNGDANIYYKNVIQLDTWYRLEAKYDGTNSLYEFKINGVTIDSGALGTPRTDSRYFYIGCNGTRTIAADVKFDLCAWDNANWIGEEATGGGTLLLLRKS